MANPADEFNPAVSIGWLNDQLEAEDGSPASRKN
jgi:hypothetical protein